MIGDIVVNDPSIVADLALLENPASAANLQWLLVNSNPVYQFINDTTATSANGNFGPWYFLEPDGTPTQSRVPLPATAWLTLAGLGLLALRRREHCSQPQPYGA